MHKAVRREGAPGQRCWGSAGLSSGSWSGLTPGLTCLPPASAGCRSVPAWHWTPHPSVLLTPSCSQPQHCGPAPQDTRLHITHLTVFTDSRSANCTTSNCRKALRTTAARSALDFARICDPAHKNPPRQSELKHYLDSTLVGLLGCLQVQSQA